MRKSEGKEKSIVVPPKIDSIIAAALDVWHSCTAYIDVQYGILLSLLLFFWIDAPVCSDQIWTTNEPE